MKIEAAIVGVNWKTQEIQKHFFAGTNVLSRAEAVLHTYEISPSWSDWDFRIILRKESKCQDS